MQQLLGGRGGQGGCGTGAANVVLAGLAVRGCTAEAVQLFDWMQQERRQQQLAAEGLSPVEGRRPGEGKSCGGGGGGRATRAAAATSAAAPPDWWTLQLLLYTALNAPREQQLLLTLRAVREARCGTVRRRRP